MRVAIVGLALTACSFELRAGGGPNDASDGGTRDSELPNDAFDAPIASTCFAGAWCRRKTITIDPGRVSNGPHVRFPVLISLPGDANLATEARADGADILFVAGDNTTRLPYERQRFVKATGELIAWVQIPTLSSTAPTLIHLYYGNANATDQQDPTTTWSEGFQGVWHLDESVTAASSLRDSTPFSNHATPTNVPTLAAPGRIGAAVGFDGADDSLVVANSASLDSTAGAGTFGMWVRFFDPSVSGTYQFLMTSSNTFPSQTDGFSWSTEPNGNYYFYPRVTSGNLNITTNPFANGTWHHAQVTFAFATKQVLLYVDGAQRTLSTMGVTAASWTQLAQPANWLFGSNPGSASNDFGGFMDEIRVSNVVRTPGWIMTEYRNQSAPATFYAVGVATVLN